MRPIDSYFCRSDIIQPPRKIVPMRSFRLLNDRDLGACGVAADKISGHLEAYGQLGSWKRHRTGSPPGGHSRGHAGVGKTM